jgi:hypothetical protein
MFYTTLDCCSKVCTTLLLLESPWKEIMFNEPSPKLTKRLSSNGFHSSSSMATSLSSTVYFFLMVFGKKPIASAISSLIVF